MFFFSLCFLMHPNRPLVFSYISFGMPLWFLDVINEKEIWLLLPSLLLKERREAIMCEAYQLWALRPDLSLPVPHQSLFRISLH